jgi:CRP-like cAMP-binding protein
MDSLRRLPRRRRLARNQANFFDPNVFLANVGAGRTVRQYRPKQAIFSQGDRADAVFYIQEGKVRLSVLSKQGKEATVALLGTADFVGEGCIASDQTLHLATATAITEVLYPEDRKEPDGAHAPR